MRSGTVDGLIANGVNHRCVTVELLTGETILISIEGKTTCSAIWNRVEGELVARGVVHPQIFGLAIKTGPDWVFVDPDAKLSKYFPKEGKSTSSTQNNTNGPINDGKQSLVLYCRVHFYLDSLPQNFDVVSVLHYYLQLRQNLTSAPRFPPASIVQPVALGFQCELGDWRPCQESPRWAQGLNTSLGSSLTRAHQALAGLGQHAARNAFIRTVMPQYNMHLFGMTLRTKDGKDAPVWIGVAPKGIEVYQNAVGCMEIPEQPKLTFLWANITKLYFERKKFEIRGRACPWAGSTQKLSFTAASESVPRHLLLLCRSTHQFHLSNHKILLTELTTVASVPHSHKPSMGNNSGDTSCNSTLLSSSRNDEKMLDLSLWADGLLLSGESSEHQRVSVISNASSNTTSGIVSDRVYSLDGSEEDLDLREISDCCTERTHNTNNSTSLESLSQRHPPPPRPHHLSKIQCNTSNLSAAEDEESDAAKFWYCDSDCEDCDDAGPCRSLLVRTIGEKSVCTGHCECNSCTADEDEIDGLELCSSELVQHHTNTPSMASELTLKAVDITASTTPTATATIKTADSLSLKTTTSTERTTKKNKDFDISKGSSGGGSGCGGSGEDDTVTGCKIMLKDKDQVQKSNERLHCAKIEVGLESEDGDNGEILEQEEYKLDDHVYGEICEDPITNNKTDDNEERQYSTIDGDDSGSSSTNDRVKVKAPKPKPRYSCIKSIEPQKLGCKCRSKEKCTSSARGTTTSTAGTTGNNKSNMKYDKSVISGKECKRSYSTNVIVAKENGLTPKIASLKCLRTQRASPWVSSADDRKCSNNKPDGALQHGNYVEFGEKLQQGRYPSTRTVSDNFDTDSDYVQLPPLFPRPLPKKPTSSKLWKLVSKNGRGVDSPDSGLSSHQQSHQTNHVSTLPRRKSEFCYSVQDETDKRPALPVRNFNKNVSKSTTALNNIGNRKPEPPPKPRKYPSLSSGEAVDARIIASKPQILVQTAYATPAPIVIPSQAQVLFRGSKVPLAGTGGPYHITQLSSAPILQHSQSVDNIYDTVACEEPFVPTVTPPLPPYPKTSAPVIIRPNNYIDVHASSVKNKTATAFTQQGGTTTATSSYLSGLGLGAGGKNIGNRCGSVPNNLNNFLIGLQNLKPLSRAPIVHPGATSCLSLSSTTNPANVGCFTTSTGTLPCSMTPGNANAMNMSLSLPMTMTNQQQPTNSTPTSGPGSRFTTVYTSQLSRSQIQQFKAQLYSDMDYVIFPPKDPRVSQQEYFDSKSLSYTTMSSSTNSNPMLSNACAYQMNDIPPPYLPPPPPYPMSVQTASVPASVASSAPPPPTVAPRHKISSATTSAAPSKPALHPSAMTTSNHSVATTTSSAPYYHTSYQSLYNVGSNISQCSSSQYGYYAGVSSVGGGSNAGHGLNAENLQRFLSTQSLAGSNTSTPIYYPSSTQSAPPLPPYKNTSQVLIENGMRKAVQLMNSRATSEERMRMKLCRSEESLYSHPTKDTEEKLQAMYNLPPPPPYNNRGQIISPSELDLATLRARCTAMELPLLRALCSDGALLTQTKPRTKIRPTAHAHPKLAPKQLSLPMKPPKPAPLTPPKPVPQQRKT